MGISAFSLDVLFHKKFMMSAPLYQGSPIIFLLLVIGIIYFIYFTYHAWFPNNINLNTASSVLLYSVNEWLKFSVPIAPLLRPGGGSPYSKIGKSCGLEYQIHHHYQFLLSLWGVRQAVSNALMTNLKCVNKSNFCMKVKEFFFFCMKWNRPNILMWLYYANWYRASLSL